MLMLFISSLAFIRLDETLEFNPCICEKEALWIFSLPPNPKMPAGFPLVLLEQSAALPLSLPPFRLPGSGVLGLEFSVMPRLGVGPRVVGATVVVTISEMDEFRMYGNTIKQVFPALLLS